MRRNANGPAPRKADLPQKLCKTCGRTIVWRRKWAKTWPGITRCSTRCRDGLRRERADGR